MGVPSSEGRETGYNHDLNSDAERAARFGLWAAVIGLATAVASALAVVVGLILH